MRETRRQHHQHGVDRWAAPSALIGVYNVGKAALVHLTKSLAAELGPRVRVNAIAPGLVKTDFARTLWEGEAGANFAAALPTKRLGHAGRHRRRRAVPGQ